MKYSVIIPHSVKHVMELDTENGNTLWADAIKSQTRWAMQSQTMSSGWWTHGQTEGYQLPISGSEEHQHSIAGFNCTS